MLQFIDHRHANNFASFTQNNIFKILEDIKAKYMNHMEKVLQFSEKLGFYRELKDNISSEQRYLNILKNLITRKIYIRLKLSNHSLHVETGRYSGPKLEQKHR